MLKVSKINSEEELDAALERIGQLLRSKEGTPEFEELQSLTNLVIAYEAIHYPVPDPSPTDWVQGRLDALGLSEDALVPIIGNREAVEKVLAREMDITPKMAQGLHRLLGIDLELLLGEATSRQG